MKPTTTARMTLYYATVILSTRECVSSTTYALYKNSQGYDIYTHNQFERSNRINFVRTDILRIFSHAYNTDLDELGKNKVSGVVQAQLNKGQKWMQWEGLRVCGEYELWQLKKISNSFLNYLYIFLSQFFQVGCLWVMKVMKKS